jgi:hypothetical protein
LERGQTRRTAVGGTAALPPRHEIAAAGNAAAVPRALWGFGHGARFEGGAIFEGFRVFAGGDRCLCALR